jgi:hypothetical protein
VSFPDKTSIFKANEFIVFLAFSGKMWEHLRTKGTMRLFQVEVAKKFWEQKKY